MLLDLYLIPHALALYAISASPLLWILALTFEMFLCVEPVTVSRRLSASSPHTLSGLEQVKNSYNGNTLIRKLAKPKTTLIQHFWGPF